LVLVGIAHDTGARGRVAARRDPRARAYAQARRHSARVRFYKWAIPLGTATAVALLVVITLAGPDGRLGGLSLGPLSFSGTKITMESPRLTGFHKDTRPYEVTATSATQDVRKPHLIELNNMRARLVIDDNGTAARLEAASGMFDTQREQLELRQEVRVATDSGHAARLKSASIDFKAGTVISRDPVAVTLINGTIDAQGIEISDNGKVLTFTGRVRTVFEGDAPDIQTSSLAEAPGAEPARSVGQTQPVSLRP
jgi:lipopolysaccharide export system protein LptC